MKIVFLTLFIFLNLFSCKPLTKEVEGIKIESVLLAHQSFQDNKNLVEIIKLCLDQKTEGFKALQKFDCRGGAGCYDLGYVLTQIIYRIGEDNYINSISKLPLQEQMNLTDLIRVGLEYGDNNYDGKMDDLRIQNAFPKISTFTNQ